jgi:uncharacterized integral membrane protein (TIGR00698 family)
MKIIPGSLCALVLSLVASLLASYFTQMGNLTIALCLGALVSNTLETPEHFKAGLNFCAKNILNLNIVLLGITLNPNLFSSHPPSTFLKICFLVALTILISYLLGKILNLKSSFSILLGIGTGICGTAAIAATSYLITNRKEEIGTSTGIIHLLGIIFLVTTPLTLSFFPNLDESSLGILIGGSLQALGHVVAAGDIFSNTTKEIAITIKMLRVSLLIPIIIALSLWKSYNSDKNTKFSKVLTKIPFYIYAFILAISISQTELIPTTIVYNLKHFSHFLMGVSMAAIGFSIKINKSTLMNLQKGIFLGIVAFLTLIGGIIILI